jgi:S1-C subfamily serine protease
VKRLAEAVSEIFTPEEIRGLWFGARFRASSNGVAAASVEAGSPADKAGLRAGDIVVRVNDQPARSVIELNRELINSGEKTDVKIFVKRKGEHLTLGARLLPEKEVFKASVIRQKIGVTVQPLTSEQAAQLSLNSSDGLWIASVEKNSPAARSNLRPGLIIQAINGQSADGILSAAKVLYGRPAGETVELTLIATRVRGNLVEIYPAKAEVVVR